MNLLQAARLMQQATQKPSPSWQPQSQAVGVLLEILQRDFKTVLPPQALPFLQAALSQMDLMAVTTPQVLQDQLTVLRNLISQVEAALELDWERYLLTTPDGPEDE